LEEEMSKATIKKRSEVELKNTWATEDLYVNDDAWKADVEIAKKMIDNIASYQGRLSESSDTLLAFLKADEEISIKFDRIGNYAQRKFDEDTKNTVYQDLENQLRSLYVSVGKATAFEVPEITAMSDETLNKFLDEKEELRIYKRYFNEIRRKREHTLSQSEEKLLAAAGDLASAPSSIMAMFRNADLEFPDITGEDGNPAKLTAGTYITFLESKDRRVREDAFMTLYHTLEKFKNTAGTAYSSHIKQQMFYANARKYNSTLEAALDSTDVPVAVYKNLIKAVHDNIHYMHKYVQLRKKLLKLDELHMYDLYTSVVEGSDQKLTYEEAKTIVMEAVAPLGKEYQAILKEGFENRWIDVYENEGKRSGAYSAGAKVHPYVLLNHKETLDSAFTLAHEMGHAIHSYLSNRTQPDVYAHYKIFVAEVASTFNEALLMQYLLGKTENKLERASLINHFLEQFRGTVFRQTMFAEFEMLTNEMAEQGKSLTAESLSKLYYDLNVKYFGDDIVVDKEIAMEWARIPHFFYNFYVYQYSTGFSAAMALSKKVLEEGEPAVKNYLKFLSGGSSASPIDLLKIAGVDMASPEPINQALSIFGKLIDELDSLLAE